MAVKCHELGLFVVAGCLNLGSDGGKKLAENYDNRMVVTQLDIRNNGSIERAWKQVNDLIVQNGLSNGIVFRVE